MANGISRFPPSFENSPLSYGMALFSLTLISAFSLAVLTGYALDARRKREIDALLDNRLPRPLSAGITPILLHRLIVSGLMLTIVFGALPDVLVLLAWGEASDRTMEMLFTLDRIGDGATIMPFMGSAFLLVWAGQGVDHRLAIDPIHRPFRMEWSMLRERLRLALLVLLIAVGVTYAKSVA